MNLLLLESSEWGPESTVRLDGRRAEHLRKVLKVEVGSTVRVGVMGQGKGLATVEAIEGENVLLRIDLTMPPDPAPQIELIVALPRPISLARLLVDVAAFGVRSVQLVNAWRVQKSYLQSPVVKPAALRQQVVLGAEQGGTTWVPEVAVHERLMACLEQLQDGAGFSATSRGGDALRNDQESSNSAREAGPLKVLAEPGSPPIESLKGWKRPVLLAVGPEGGWIDRELQTFEGLGFAAVSMGSGVLRTHAAVNGLLAQVALLRRMA